VAAASAPSGRELTRGNAIDKLPDRLVLEITAPGRNSGRLRGLARARTRQSGVIIIERDANNMWDSGESVRFACKQYNNDDGNNNRKRLARFA